MLQVVCCCCSEYQSQIPSEVCFLKHWDLHWAILTTGPRSNPVTSWVVHQTKNRNQEISIFTLFIPSYVVFTHCITSSLFFFSFSNVHSSRTNSIMYLYIIMRTERSACESNEWERNVFVEQPSGEIGSYTTEISSRLRPFGGRYLPYVATRPTIEF